MAKIRNTARLLAELYALLEEMDDDAQRGYERARDNVDLSLDIHLDTRARIADLRKKLRDELEPILERQSDRQSIPIEDRLDKIEERLARLEGGGAAK